MEDLHMEDKLILFVAFAKIMGSVGKLYSTKSNYYKTKSKAYSDLANSINALMDVFPEYKKK